MTASGRNYATYLEEAAEYWERVDESHLGYDIDFDVRPDSTDADIVLRVVNDIDTCGEEDDDSGSYLGCADINNPDGSAPPRTDARIVGGLTQSSAVEVMKHEIGHTLGLTHDDDPQSVMSATTMVRVLSEPDVDERNNPWQNNPITVEYDLSSISEANRSEVRKQLDHAVEYYNGGADGHMPDGVSFRTVDTDGDITIEVSPGAYDTDMRRWGYDTDTDTAFEYYSRMEITISGVYTEHTGWHAGYWLGYAFGASDTDDLPPPFDDPNTDERSDWWM